MPTNTANQFTLSNAMTVLPVISFADEETKYQFLSGELTVILERMVREGSFDISRGKKTISFRPQSTFSTFITSTHITRYNTESGWKLSLINPSYIEVKVPTYYYSLTILNNLSVPQASQLVEFNKGTAMTPVYVSLGNTTADGKKLINVTDLLKPHGIHPSSFASFLFRINSTTLFTVAKTDTLYQLVQQTITLP